MDQTFYNDRYETQETTGRGSYNVDNFFRIPAVRTWLKEQPTISLLDVGCGAGIFCGQITGRLSRDKKLSCVAGIDLVDSIREKPDGFLFATCNVNDEAIPHEEETFDLVFCNHVAEHLFNTEHLFDELYRVVRPGGLVVVSVPNLGWWGNRILLALGIQPLGTEVGTKSITYGTGPLKSRLGSYLPAGHIRCFTPAALQDIAVASGFIRIGWWSQDFRPGAQWAPRLGRNIGIVLKKSK